MAHKTTLVAPLEAKPLRCVECNGDATAKCLDCDDSFCKACFRRFHKKGKRKNHRWYGFKIGATVCVECEREVARKKCRQCQDSYCNSCAEKTHKTENRKTHQFDLIREDLPPDAGPNDVYCQECTVRVAMPLISACKTCGGRFCDSCLVNEHKDCASGLKVDADEGEGPHKLCAVCSEAATRICLQCDEAYCDLKWAGNDGCYEKFHSKGNRRFHAVKPL